jgi:hypothetical protein
MTTVVDERVAGAAEALPEGDRGRTHLRVAPDLVRRRRRARLAFWATVLVTVASLFALVSFHVMAVQQAFELDALTARQAEEARRYEQLRAEVARLSSPPAVVEAAEAMGMIFAAEPATQVDAPIEPPAEPADQGISEALSEAHQGAKPSLGP